MKYQTPGSSDWENIIWANQFSTAQVELYKSIHILTRKPGERGIESLTWSELQKFFAMADNFSRALLNFIEDVKSR